MVVNFKKITIFLLMAIIIFTAFFISTNNAFAETDIDVTAEAAIIYLEDTDEILYSKGLDVINDLASTTKLMTTMIALEYLDINEEVTFDGYEMTLYEFLHYVLLESNNEAATYLAELVCEKIGIDDFTSLMQEKSEEIGLEDTEFHNPSGLYDENMGTISDLVKIAKSAFQNDIIKEIASKSEYTTNNGTTINSTNAFLNGSTYEDSDGNTIEIPKLDEVICGKTGTFGHYGEYHCNLIVLCEIEGMNCYVAVMDTTPLNRFPDVEKLIEASYGLVNPYNVFLKGDTFEAGEVYYGATNLVTGCAKSDGLINLPEGISLSLITTKVYYYDDLSAPINTGDKIGDVKIYIADELVKTVDLLANEDIPKGWFLSKYRVTNKQTIVIGLIVFVVLFIYILILIIRAKNKKIAKLKRQQKIREAALKELEKERDKKNRDWNY